MVKTIRQFLFAIFLFMLYERLIRFLEAMSLIRFLRNYRVGLKHGRNDV